MLVRNLKNIADRACPCGSLLKHWEKFSGLTASKCFVLGCRNYHLVGAHVRIVSHYDTNTYIVPLCYEHNQSDEILDIGTTRVVSANIDETCGSE